MAPLQKIVRVRRTYNQWVANQTLEDFALRFTAKGARRWSALRVANTALGAISFLALEAIGGTVTLNYGFTNAMAAIIAVSILIFVTALPISYYAARYGVDIDLLTRGAGFGYIGSTITSLIYASFTFIFFAIEAAIMALALEMGFGIPLSAGYLISSLAVIPLVTHGITFISRFQLWTQPIWLVLHVLPFVFIALHHSDGLGEWTGYTGSMGDRDGSFDLLLFGAASGVIFALIAQIGEQVDFLRFMPVRRRGRRLVWWVSLLSAGPGWIVPGAIKLAAGSFLAVLAVNQGVAVEHAAEPTRMYLIAFGYMFSSADVALFVMVVFVVVSQLKINVTNSYAGSIAWSNFFSRLTHSHPGRVVWLVFNVTIAFLLMAVGIYKALEQILGLYSIVAVSWVGAIVADLLINKPLGLSPPHIEFKRAHLYDINPVGLGSMVLGTLTAAIAFTGAFGVTLQALAPFLALAVPFVSAPLIAWATGGRYYIARSSSGMGAGATPDAATVRCVICEHVFEREDMAFCPAYSGAICSLCCSLDARCHDVCKTQARMPEQVLGWLRLMLPERMVGRVNSRIGHYLSLLTLFGAIIGAILTVIYHQAVLNDDAHRETIAAIFWNLFFILMIIAGVATWLFVLAQESRKVAQEESMRQTNLLMQEIEAHDRTDAKLQKAKEVAEAANHAKSRYVVGMSHELRSPLNAIFGYAQLLEADTTIPPRRRDAIKVIRRSSEHLTSLIEGLLDISKIEAGRLRLNRDEVHLVEFLNQIVDMFRLQATAKGIDFRFDRPDTLPLVVYTDAKRLRQILINLLSNAIKFTPSGFIALRIRYRSQVAEIEIEDSGIGILPDDIGRIFEPFERGQLAGARKTPGTGLGLTITKLLTEIMGGEVSVSSATGKGSVFRVKLLLSEVRRPSRLAPVAQPVTGYDGPRRTVLIADDDPAHRDLAIEILGPLGFIVFTAEDGASCIALAEEVRPDLVLLDISMPGIDGRETARLLRLSRHLKARIVMISANAAEGRPVPGPDGKISYDAYMEKPITIPALLETIRSVLDLDWVHGVPAEPAAAAAPGFGADAVPERAHLDDLRQLGRIGYVRGIKTKLDEIEVKSPECEPFTSHMKALVNDLALDDYMRTLEALDGDAGQP
ncbi:hybrid sensor histidine kinase/response regulator [Skermanella aerolata]|uniref:histidine kinase n=1 Tax=Skermanella aerolata TaxID=393310 RepID=A0A512DNI7_9PROT|nr:ATP-binding protein [Skermanella aerolata]KJB96624.1 ATPase [Skermanella aerolata KACC 11604]GEO37740.1 hybrid sensor histidine kinase/response regulator [Skermanella aerolata]